MQKKKIVVGMSGGVDSSVAALLLQQQGHEVIGVFMKNWSDETVFTGAACPWEQDYQDARLVARQLNIPLYTVQFEQEYKAKVVDYFFAEYAAGRTPNPDILCNSEIKFKLFFDYAMTLGADAIATGHYARTSTDKKTGLIQLLKGCDPQKDQSYFLFRIDQAALDATLFPVGDLHKSEVRKVARQAGLATQDKKDSQGICFIGDIDVRKFIADNTTQYNRPGDIINKETGEVIGRHTGLTWYTIGQRRGIPVSGTGLPMYVVDKDMQQNILYVVKGNYNPLLFSDRLVATDVLWRGEVPAEPLLLCAKIRYRQSDQQCTVVLGSNDNPTSVLFAERQRAITPGQSVVWYDGDICVGGGIIA